MPFKYELSGSYMGTYHTPDTEPKDELEQALEDIVIDKLVAKLRKTLGDEDSFDFKSYFEDEQRLDSMTYEELELEYGETFAMTEILNRMDEALAASDPATDASSTGAFGDPYAPLTQDPGYTFELGYAF